jgi:hypothetical protein
MKRNRAWREKTFCRGIEPPTQKEGYGHYLLRIRMEYVWCP